MLPRNRFLYIHLAVGLNRRFLLGRARAVFGGAGREIVRRIHDQAGPLTILQNQVPDDDCTIPGEPSDVSVRMFDIVTSRKASAIVCQPLAISPP